MLTVGQAVKDFTLQDKDGASISLSDFKGQKVVVYFYPKDETPGCIKQACTFRDSYAGFQERKITVIGISRDSVGSHQKFAEKYDLPFLLLADPDGTVIDAFGVKGIFGAVRATFLISEQGLVEKVFEKASPDTNAADILAYLGEHMTCNSQGPGKAEALCDHGCADTPEKPAQADDTICSAEFPKGCI